MYLTRHSTVNGPRWAADGMFLPEGMSLSMLLGMDADMMRDVIDAAQTDIEANGAILPPAEPVQEVWAAGVTYLRSREARMHESDTADIYDKVYDAERVEVFFKALGRRVMGHGQPIRVRRDSRWNVPEPELTLVINANGDIVGYTAGNDVSSRDIEGANPLYLPQAKVYTGSAALGPGIVLCNADDQRDLPIVMQIRRRGEKVFSGEIRTSQLKRSLEEIAEWLLCELDFPAGVFLMTGTGIVPDDEFSLSAGDHVRIEVGSLALENEVKS
ncbi:MAG: fumarylacetoacetate hydrolase family protein [Gammaproteobacteria bacterium]|nr:fumarylacetoacetate hydrolase family protein [Gammaproteobacteria bacterium]